MKTQTIAGHSITLVPGTRYRASRNIKRLRRTDYQVSIRRISEVGSQPASILHTEPDVVVEELSYDEANDLVNAFNNGVTSLEGRVW